jgi:adenylosuccinate lyase
VAGRELDRYLPFLATTRILVEATRRGLGREVAHAVIKEHALAAAQALRESDTPGNDLLDRLGADARLGLTRAELGTLVGEPETFTGAASAQVRTVVDRITAIVALHPDVGHYTPAPIV